MTMDEPTTVGLTQLGHERLKQLKSSGYFAEMTDAYRFAIALALAHGGIAEPAARGTIFNVGSLDPDRSIYQAISALAPEKGEPIYKLAERLAEWGLTEMCRQMEQGTLSIATLLSEAAALNEGGPSDTGSDSVG
jgi:hypothetical protein